MLANSVSHFSLLDENTGVFNLSIWMENTEHECGMCYKSTKYVYSFIVYVFIIFNYFRILWAGQNVRIIPAFAKQLCYKLSIVKNEYCIWSILLKSYFGFKNIIFLEFL